MAYVYHGVASGDVDHLQDFVRAMETLQVGAIWPIEYNYSISTEKETDREAFQFLVIKPWAGLNTTLEPIPPGIISFYPAFSLFILFLPFLLICRKFLE